MLPEAVDTVIPVETDEKTKIIAVPYDVGSAMRKQYRKNRRLDLSVLDSSYLEIKRDFGMCKREIRDRMKDLGLAEDSIAIQEMEQVRF